MSGNFFLEKLRKCGTCATTELGAEHARWLGFGGVWGLVSATPLYMSRTYFYPAIFYALTQTTPKPQPTPPYVSECSINRHKG